MDAYIRSVEIYPCVVCSDSVATIRLEGYLIIYGNPVAFQVAKKVAGPGVVNNTHAQKPGSVLSWRNVETPFQRLMSSLSSYCKAPILGFINI